MSNNEQTHQLLQDLKGHEAFKPLPEPSASEEAKRGYNAHVDQYLVAQLDLDQDARTAAAAHAKGKADDLQRQKIAQMIQDALNYAREQVIDQAMQDMQGTTPDEGDKVPTREQWKAMQDYAQEYRRQFPRASEKAVRRAVEANFPIKIKGKR